MSTHNRTLFSTGTVAVIVCGNSLDWYDFAVYGYFVRFVADQFFPEQDRAAALLAAFGVFALARSADSGFTYDRQRAYKISLTLRQAGAKLRTVAETLTKAELRPKNARRYTVSSSQDLLRGSIMYNTNTPQGLALHLKETGHSLRDICDKLLAQGFTAPRGRRWYPKTVEDLMKREEGGVFVGSRRVG